MNEIGGITGGKKPLKAVGKRSEAKIYRMQYLWGQLLAWYKQTVYDPSASLSADRRGVLSLPDIETTLVSKALRQHPLKSLKLREENKA